MSETSPTPGAYVSGNLKEAPRAHVLVIEDHVGTGVWMGRALQEQGFAVRWKRRAEHALLALDEAPSPDVIMLDLMLPGTDGAFIYDRIRERQELARTPILVVTAMAEQDLPAWDDKRVRFLIKPVARKPILETLEDLLAR
jgi:two-component system phosphate regulon response regulator PhoB